MSNAATLSSLGELSRCVETLSDDESYIKKLLTYAKRLVSKKNATEYITEEEILAGIDAGLKDMKAGRGTDAWEFLKELRDESYN